MMKAQNNMSKSNRTTDRRSNSPKANYYVDIATLLPFLLLLFTGIIMLNYHTGKPYLETTLGKDGDFWLNTHIVFAVISFIMITIHLSLHLKWFKKLFTGKLKNKYWIKNLILVIVFSLTFLTSSIPWLILDESNTSTMMLGIHNKLGLLTIIFFVIHLLSYFKWLVNMTKKAFSKN